MRVNSFLVVIVLLSLLFVKESTKVFASNIFDCSYNKNIILDSNLQTYSLLICTSKHSHIFITFISFISMLSFSLLFLLLDDRRMSTSLLMLSFFFLFVDILLFFYGRISYLFLIPFLPFMLSTFMKVK